MKAITDDTDQSVRTASLVGGVGLLLMAILAPFGNFVAIAGLVTPGDAEKTATAIMASEVLFRLGIVSLLLVVVLDVIVAWALWRLLQPVSAGLSMLAAWFRILYACIFLVAISQLVGVLNLLSNAAYLRVFDRGQLNAQALLGITSFHTIWDVGLLLFGLHLLLLGYLAYRSGYVPRWLGILLVIAAMGYLFDGFAAVLLPGFSIKIATFTFLGEVLFLFWLLIWGRRITLSAPSKPAQD